MRAVFGTIVVLCVIVASVKAKECAIEGGSGRGICIGNPAYCKGFGGAVNIGAQSECPGQVCCSGMSTGDLAGEKAWMAQQAAQKAKNDAGAADYAEKQKRAARMEAARNAPAKRKKLREGGRKNCLGGGRCVQARLCKAANGKAVNAMGTCPDMHVCCQGMDLGGMGKRRKDARAAKGGQSCSMTVKKWAGLSKKTVAGKCTPTTKAGPNCQAGGGCPAGTKCC